MTELIKGGDAGVKIYEQLDVDTADFLRKKESNMREIVGKAYTELGRELTEARDRLAGSNQYDGVFEKWYTSLGFKKDRVYDLIRRYEMLLGLSDDQTRDLLEDLPVTLSYEIARPSAESTPEKAQAKAEVLAGEIATNKAYKDRIKELEKQAQEAERRAAQAERSEKNATDKLEEIESGTPEVEIRTEYIEVESEESRKKVERYEELFGDISLYDGQAAQVTNGDAITYTVFEFTKDVREFIEKYGHLTHFAREFNAMIGEGKQEYKNAINDMYRVLEAIERNMDEECVIING